MKDRLGRYLLAWRIQTVLPYITGRLLDIGCGTNELVKAYPREGVGVDVYPWGNVDLVVEDSSRLPFNSEDFETVTIIATLNHIPNREAVLAEARRVLRPYGRIIVTMISPKLSAIWHFLRRPWDADQRERGMKPGEVFGLAPKEVRRLLSEAGYTILFERKFMLGINRMTVAEKQ